MILDTTGDGKMPIGPKRKDRRRYSYNESADEPAPLVEREGTDIEKDNPIDDTDPVEQADEQEGTTPPIFEE